MHAFANQLSPFLFAAEQLIEILEENKSDIDDLFSICNIFETGYLRSHNARTNHDTYVILSHFVGLSPGQKLFLEELNEQK